MPQEHVTDVLPYVKAPEGTDLFYEVKANLDERDFEVFKQAIENVKPFVEVRSKRIGGANYQVPMQVNRRRQQSLTFRWIISAARGRNENTMVERLSNELLDAANNRGVAVKKREDTHRMAEANRAFSHYRW